jgi:carbonic anhydrase
MPMPSNLAKGYELFRRQRFPQEVERYRALASGQQPETMVIACADSRVDPAAIFHARPGELFVVRNVAALVPPCEADGNYHGSSAAIEFAVTGLGVKSIVVLGHGQCGGVAASLRMARNDPPAGAFIGPWVSLLASTRDDLIEHRPDLSPRDRQQALEFLAVKQSLLNLTTFPFVAAATEKGTLELHGAWFSIGQGELRWLENDNGTFDVVSTGAAPIASGPICIRSARGQEAI